MRDVAQPRDSWTLSRAADFDEVCGGESVEKDIPKKAPSTGRAISAPWTKV